MVSYKEKGFTLVELSIVIVIIGLIVAGVVGGQALIRQAQLRAMISEQGAVKTAVKAFRVEYNALPGDFDNARSYWTSCGASASECNGDGNKSIDIVASDVDENEAYRAWQHLNLAGLYPGALTGVATGTAFNGGDRGVNLPGSKYPGVSITLYTDTTTRTNFIMFGADVADAISSGDILTVGETSSVDQKMDDGLPTTGITRASGSTASDCYNDNGTAADTTDDTYNLSNTTGTPCYMWVLD